MAWSRMAFAAEISAVGVSQVRLRASGASTALERPLNVHQVVTCG
jgi:hypothetical protein